MKKKTYIEPLTQVVVLQQQHQLLTGSTYGVNEQLINTPVNDGWSRELDALNLEGQNM